MQGFPLLPLQPLTPSTSALLGAVSSAVCVPIVFKLGCAGCRGLAPVNRCRSLWHHMAQRTPPTPPPVQTPHLLSPRARLATEFRLEKKRLLERAVSKAGRKAKKRAGGAGAAGGKAK